MAPIPLREHYDIAVVGSGFAGLGMAIELERDGETWSAGLRAHRGTAVAGFPNLLILSGPNTGTGSTSQVYMIESQIRYNRDLDARMERTVWLRGGCNSSYLDDQGRNGTLYPGPRRCRSPSSSGRAARRWRAAARSTSTAVPPS